METWLGLLFLIIFVVLMLVYMALGRKHQTRDLRDIAAFTRLRRMVGLAVEAGTRIHISLGRGGVSGVQGASAIVGLTMLERVARAASISDRPPIATSGEGVLNLLSQSTLQGAYHTMGAEAQYDPQAGQMSGITPFSFAAGVMSTIHDEQVSANLLAGNFGSEVVLLTEASERSGGVTIAGSDHLLAQAVLYASASEPLVGEELYAGGAYLGAGPAHSASLKTQDIMRWVLIAALIIVSVAKFMGF